MDWLDSVQNIRRLKNENRLVIFVGAGVSKNSDMPLWSELNTLVPCTFKITMTGLQMRN